MTEDDELERVEKSWAKLIKDAARGDLGEEEETLCPRCRFTIFRGMECPNCKERES
jgi:hypothetical protein